ncbi:hypothetical protein ACFSQU_20900 [Massilia sp. GCM10020059]|uniref:Uncharacterized protein n=1 Tax=Massilia agrisoli TaxID=2892444 RepID=A0ABS8IXT2_9BURK|nr:hypothetical protein [Massilia agrisoli]MCC6071995.1 hypothetical protein [Massilia agrisoli]
MSERSFALGCVGLALAFGLVVPDPGKAPAPSAAPAIVMAQPAPQPAPAKEVDRMEGVPFAVHHAAAPKPDTTPALLWAVRSAP